jgi:hypothetical protein
MEPSIYLFINRNFQGIPTLKTGKNITVGYGLIFDAWLASVIAAIKD